MYLIEVSQLIDDRLSFRLYTPLKNDLNTVFEHSHLK